MGLLRNPLRPCSPLDCQCTVTQAKNLLMGFFLGVGTTEPVQFRRGRKTFKRQIWPFLRQFSLSNVRMPERRRTVAKLNSKRPLFYSKAPLNWTGSVFPLLIFLIGCFPGDFEEGKWPSKAFSEKAH